MVRFFEKKNGFTVLAIAILIRLKYKKTAGSRIQTVILKKIMQNF